MCQTICLIPAFDFNKRIFHSSGRTQAQLCSGNQWGCLLRITAAVNSWPFSRITKWSSFFNCNDLSLIYFTCTAWWGNWEGCGLELVKRDVEVFLLSELRGCGVMDVEEGGRVTGGVRVWKLKLWVIQTDRDRAVWASACPSPLLSGCCRVGRNRLSLRLQCFLTGRKILLEIYLWCK